MTEVKTVKTRGNTDVIVRLLKEEDIDKFMDLHASLNEEDNKMLFLINNISQKPSDKLIRQTNMSRIQDGLVLGCFNKIDGKLLSVAVCDMNLENRGKGKDFDADNMLLDLKNTPMLQERCLITHPKYRGEGMISILRNQLRNIIIDLLNGGAENIKMKSTKLSNNVERLSEIKEYLHLCSSALLNNIASLASSISSGMTITGIDDHNGIEKVITTKLLMDSGNEPSQEQKQKDEQMGLLTRLQEAENNIERRQILGLKSKYII